MIRGGAVADESSLTGEALPVAKFAVDESARVFDRNGSKTYMLFAGSKVAQTNAVGGVGIDERVCAVVTDTGADTVKGRLVKDILYPTKIVFVFLEHLKLVFGVLIVWGVILLMASVGMLGGDSVDSWFYGMFTISQVLSPLLPAVLVIGQSVAAERLRTRGILCVDLQRITLGGKVKIFAFDKTGMVVSS